MNSPDQPQANVQNSSPVNAAQSFFGGLHGTKRVVVEFPSTRPTASCSSSDGGVSADCCDCGDCSCDCGKY